jgi:hypothetical protein
MIYSWIGMGCPAGRVGVSDYLQSGVASVRAPDAAAADLHQPLYLPDCQGAWLLRRSELPIFSMLA